MQQARIPEQQDSVNYSKMIIIFEQAQIKRCHHNRLTMTVLRLHRQNSHSHCSQSLLCSLGLLELDVTLSSHGLRYCSSANQVTLTPMHQHQAMSNVLGSQDNSERTVA